MKILIIEDTLSDQKIIEHQFKALNRDDLNLTFVTFLSEAREKCNQEKFDLIFMDLLLPDCMDINTTTEFIRKYKQHGIIMVSAQDSSEVIFECIKEGALDYMIKPILKHEDLSRMLFYAHFRN